MFFSNGSPTTTLTSDDVQQLIASAFGPLALDGKRVLVIIPDSTRTAPIPLIFELLYKQIGKRVSRLDYLIALGTHQPMNEDAIGKLVGVSKTERKERYPNVEIFNHRWDDPRQLQTIGTISGDEVARLTNSLICDPIPVRLNKLINDYDQLIICGPVFPHEVIGFSGGAKYLFPGIAGAEIINATHWLGALVTCMRTIGIKETPVRRVVHRAAELVKKDIVCVAMTLKGTTLHGMFIGSYIDAFSAAADLSAQLNIIYVPHAFKHVLSMPSEMYDDLWTAAKAMYKTEPAIADGGDVIIYAPHIAEVSYTHGRLIDEVGYHVRDYFTKQSERFKSVPGAIKAHSTHVKGIGEYDATTRKESPRISVILATKIPEERCKRINLGFVDYRTISINDWKNRESQGVLLVEHAGEMLYRARDLEK
jgi:lactate racemase